MKTKNNGMLIKLQQKQKIALNNKENIAELPIKLLKENPYQPRLDMDSDKLQELANSIQEEGLIQAIPVARYNKGKSDEEIIIIAGHRRLAACKLNHMDVVKVDIRDDVPKKSLAAMSLIENLQRENLDIIEVSLQYKKLLDDKIFVNSKELSKSIGVSESTISRTLRINKLPQIIVEDVKINKSTKDIIVLSALSKVDNDDIAFDIYSWFIETNAKRKDVLQKIKEYREGEIKNNKTQTYKISNTKKGCTIKLPQLSDKQLKEINNFINILVSNI